MVLKLLEVNNNEIVRNDDGSSTDKTNKILVKFKKHQKNCQRLKNL